jgi:hypothetical protein
LFLVLAAYSTTAGGWLHGWITSHIRAPWLSQTAVVVGFMAFCIVGFQFFNLFVSSLYYCLWADVVPESIMGRFVAYTRLATMGAQWLWSYYIFGMADRHMSAVFIGAGLLYLLAFIPMCLRVKEGEYPPPAERRYGGRMFGPAVTYFYECFRNPYYIYLFIGMAAWSASAGCRPFIIFFYRDTLHLTLDQIGKVNSWCVILNAILLIPIGYISDWLRPLRVVMLAIAATLVMALVDFAFIRDERTLLICMLLTTTPYAFFVTALFPMLRGILPLDRFGQFTSANALVGSACGILVTPLAGLFMDWTGDCRYGFLWQAVFCGISLCSMLLVYRGWLRYGGAKNYRPPPVGVENGVAEPATTPAAEK